MIECICDELGKKDGRLCRLSVSDHGVAVEGGQKPATPGDDGMKESLAKG